MSGWRARLHEIIFEAETPEGKAFDLALLAGIVASVTTVLLDSVATVRASYGPILHALEWAFTILFTLEGPRLLRIFRVLKLVQFVGGADALGGAAGQRAQEHRVPGRGPHDRADRGRPAAAHRGESGGFTSIPQGMYWAIVTLTTVGYGDITPQAVPGTLLASIEMILGYGILAVPTGIVTVELAYARRAPISTEACRDCRLLQVLRRADLTAAPPAARPPRSERQARPDRASPR